DEGMGTVVYQDDAHLRGPLGLVLTPNGDLITTNGDAVNGDPNFPSEMVEFTPQGKFVDQVSVDTGGQGGAFGIALEKAGNQVRLAAVDDVANTLEVWTIGLRHHSQSAPFDVGHHKGRPIKQHLADGDAQELLFATSNAGGPDSPARPATNQVTAPGSGSGSGKFLAALSNGGNVIPTAALNSARPASIWTAHKPSIDLLFADLGWA